MTRIYTSFPALKRWAIFRVRGAKTQTGCADFRTDISEISVVFVEEASSRPFG